MNKNLKSKLCLVLTIMVITFTLLPRTLLASNENDNSKRQIVYLKGAELNVEEVSKTQTITSDCVNYIIVFNGPIDENMKEEITDLGVELVEYIPDFSYLSRLSSNIIVDVIGLPFIEEVIVYESEYKINPMLMENDYNLVGDIDKIKVRVATFEDPSILIDYVENIEGNVLDTTKDELIVELNRNNIGELAELDSVKYIEPIVEHELYNDVARGYMGVDNIAIDGYEGQGQVVCVCDTGLDTGVNDSTMHKDFQGRIDNIFALGRPTADDTHGHGTHVSGSVLGSGEESNGQITGIATQAHLVMQSILDANGGLGGLPNDLNTLFQQGKNAGADIHTNSWGASVYGQYTGESQDVDEFVWNNDDMIILFSAGNSGGNYYGPVYNSIGSPGTAKNCITVGASENDRPTKGTTADNPQEIAYFSSRGNCDDGRTKPDIVAPGTWILSTRSTLAPDSIFWEGYNSYYAYMGGTSMSTPLTAGAVAVAREYMIKEWNHTPSAAMIKAAIINGGTDLGLGFPSRDQGWGRISLEDSLKTKEYEFVDQDFSLSTNQTKDFTYSIESNSEPFRVTLVWSDYPGSTSASKALVNDLDVKITSPSGVVYYGNDFSQPYDTSYDRINNVENIYIDNPETGDYSIEVIGYNVPQGPQPFVLYSSADFGSNIIDNEDPECNITLPNDGDEVNGLITINADATDNVAVAKVEFYVDDNKIGEVNDGNYSLDWDTTNVNNASHSLKIKAIDTSDNETISNEITVIVNNAPPIGYVTKTFTGTANLFKKQRIEIEVAAPGIIDFDITGNKKSLRIKLYDPNDKKVGSSKSAISYDATEIGTYTVVVSTASIFGADFTLNGKYPSILEEENTLDSNIVELPKIEQQSIIEEGDTINDVISIYTNLDEDSTIKAVEVYIDDEKVIEYEEAPQSIEWDTKTVEDGSHNMKIVVIDEEGNMIPSTEISFNVDNNEEE